MSIFICEERYFCNIVEYQRSVINEYKKIVENLNNEIVKLKEEVK